MGLFLLDYGAGNVQSLANTIKRLGHTFQWIKEPEDFARATVSFFILFPRRTPFPIDRLPESYISWGWSI